MIPYLNPDSRLSLAPGEWWTADGPVGQMSLDVYVSDVDRAGGDRYTVTGHVMECRWRGSDCFEPCVYIEVTGAAIAQALARR